MTIVKRSSLRGSLGLIKGWALKKRLNQLLNSVWQPVVCPNVKAWIKAHPNAQAEIVKAAIAQPQTVQLTLPNTIEPEIHPRFLSMMERDGLYTSSEKYLARISNPRIVGQNGLIVLPDGSYALEPLMSREHAERLPEYYSFTQRQLVKTNPVKQQGTYYSILQMYGQGNNPYHWLHDVLQNLRWIVELLPKDTTYIVPQGLREWQYESLAAVGIHKAQTTPLPLGEIWQVASLYFSPPTKRHSRDLPGLNEWLRDKCYQKFEIDADRVAPTELIYISRELARGRKIVNETALEALLAEHGFKKYLLETMTFEQIVRLFASAKAVVAPHGAGLANLIFSQQGTKILEILEATAEGIGICFWSLSEVMGHEHWYLLGDTVENLDEATQANMKVSIEKVERSLQCLLS